MEKEKKAIYKKIWFWIVLIIIISAIISMNEENNTTPTSNPLTETTQSQEKFTLIDSEENYDGFGYYIIGTITNNTNKQYSYVQVTFNLYDSDGAQIGTAIDNINNLEPNATWKFKAIGMENASSYKLSEITGW